MAARAILGAEPRPRGLLVDAPAGICHLSWEIKPSHTLVRVQSNLPGPCNSRAGTAALAVEHIPGFPCRLSDPSHAGLGMCPSLHSVESPGMLRAVGADHWQLREARQAPGTVAKPQGGRGLRPCVCYRITCPWCHRGLSMLCCGSGSAQCHCCCPSVVAVPRGQCTVTVCRGRMRAPVPAGTAAA